MSSRAILQPGMRVCLSPGTLARVNTGAVDARAVPYENGTVRDAGLFLAAVSVGGLAIGLDDPIRVELVASVHTEVSIVPLAEVVSPGESPGLATWVRMVDSVGAWTPFTAPKALFPGQVKLRQGDIVAAPRECVVWIRMGQAWWPLSDGAPVRWDGPAEIEVKPAIPSTEHLESLWRWTAVTSMRLAHMLDVREAARVRSLISDSYAAQTASRATRDAIAGIRDMGGDVRGQPIVRRALALAVPGVTFPPLRQGQDAERGDARFASYAFLAATVSSAGGHNSDPLAE